MPTLWKPLNTVKIWFHFITPDFPTTKYYLNPHKLTETNRKLDHGYWGLGQGRQGMFFSFLCSNKSLFKEHLKGWRDYIYSCLLNTKFLFGTIKIPRDWQCTVKQMHWVPLNCTTTIMVWGINLILYLFYNNKKEEKWLKFNVIYVYHNSEEREIIFKQWKEMKVF